MEHPLGSLIAMSVAILLGIILGNKLRDHLARKGFYDRWITPLGPALAPDQLERRRRRIRRLSIVIGLAVGGLAASATREPLKVFGIYAGIYCGAYALIYFLIKRRAGVK